MHQHKLLQQSQQQEREAQSRILMQKYSLLARKWQLTKSQAYALLNFNSLHQIANWQQSLDNLVLTDAQMERLSFLLALNQSLEQHISTHDQISLWIHHPHDHLIEFAQQSPFERFTHANKHELQELLAGMPSCF